MGNSITFYLISNLFLETALLEISKAIKFSKTVQPACISAPANDGKNKTYHDEIALISGWGNLAEQYDAGMWK